MYPINSVNLHNVLCQLCLNKARKKKISVAMKLGRNDKLWPTVQIRPATCFPKQFCQSSHFACVLVVWGWLAHHSRCDGVCSCCHRHWVVSKTQETLLPGPFQKSLLSPGLGDKVKTGRPVGAGAVTQVRSDGSSASRGYDEWQKSEYI